MTIKAVPTPYVQKSGASGSRNAGRLNYSTKASNLSLSARRFYVQAQTETKLQKKKEIRSYSQNADDSKFEVLIEIHPNDGRSMIEKIAQKERYCLVSFIYPYNPKNQRELDALTYLWVSEDDLEKI